MSSEIGALVSQTLVRRCTTAVPERSVYMGVVMNSHAGDWWSHGEFIRSILKPSYKVRVSLRRLVSVRGQMYLH